MGRQSGKMGKTVKTESRVLTVPTAEMGGKVGPEVAEEMVAMAQVLHPTINITSINTNRTQVLPTAVMAEMGGIPKTVLGAMVAQVVNNMLIPVQFSMLMLKLLTIPALGVLLLSAGPLKAETSRKRSFFWCRHRTAAMVVTVVPRPEPVMAVTAVTQGAVQILTEETVAMAEAEVLRG